MRGPEVGALDGQRIGRAAPDQLQVGLDGEITRDDLDGIHGVLQLKRRDVVPLVQHVRHDRRGAHLQVRGEFRHVGVTDDDV